MSECVNARVYVLCVCVRARMYVYVRCMCIHLNVVCVCGVYLLCVYCQQLTVKLG